MKLISKPKIKNLIKLRKILKVLITLFFLDIYIYFFQPNFTFFDKDDITLVTALFKIKSKFPFDYYLTWVENLLLLNRSIVFYVDKRIFKIVKSKRPKIYKKKTIWIKTSIKEFFSYKYFKNNFEDTFKIDIEKSYHTVSLYLIWAEKCSFIKKAIYKNFFHSKCFYWIDAGYFRDKENKYINNWPSIQKCYEDPRVLINGIRKLSKEEIKGLKIFNISIYNNLINKTNVGGGLFGGKPEYVLIFSDLYYKAIKEFIKHKMFIGKDQNIFAYVSYLNPKIVKIINSAAWYYFKKYLSE